MRRGNRGDWNTDAFERKPAEGGLEDEGVFRVFPLLLRCRATARTATPPAIPLLCATQRRQLRRGGCLTPELSGTPRQGLERRDARWAVVWGVRAA